jgi:DNA-binding XRE family transcriptional regulator
MTLKAQKPLNSAYPLELRTLGDHIRKRRLDLKLFQKEVARLIGVDEVTIWNWENNKVKPTHWRLPKIIKFLGYVPGVSVRTRKGKMISCPGLYFTDSRQENFV